VNSILVMSVEAIHHEDQRGHANQFGRPDCDQLGPVDAYTRTLPVLPILRTQTLVVFEACNSFCTGQRPRVAGCATLRNADGLLRCCFVGKVDLVGPVLRCALHGRVNARSTAS